VNFNFKRWRKHQHSNRHFILWTPRNMLRADNIRRLLFPDLAWIATTSSLICYNNICASASIEAVEATRPGVSTLLQHSMMVLPIECFTLTSVALGLLVTFKTQMGYGRFLEGRNLWGTLINESRALASRVMSRVSPHSAGTFDSVTFKAACCQAYSDLPLHAQISSHRRWLQPAYRNPFSYK